MLMAAIKGRRLVEICRKVMKTCEFSMSKYYVNLATHLYSTNLPIYLILLKKGMDTRYALSQFVHLFYITKEGQRYKICAEPIFLFTLYY